MPTQASGGVARGHLRHAVRASSSASSAGTSSSGSTRSSRRVRRPCGYEDTPKSVLIQCWLTAAHLTSSRRATRSWIDPVEDDLCDVPLEQYLNFHVLRDSIHMKFQVFPGTGPRP